METGCLCKGKSTGRCLCVAYAKAKALDVVFAYSTAQNAFCCLVGAILNILCPRERWVFQSKLGVSSSNRCNLHHSPHTGHLEKKIEKGTIFFGHGVHHCPQSFYQILLCAFSFISPQHNAVRSIVMSSHPCISWECFIFMRFSDKILYTSCERSFAKPFLQIAGTRPRRVV